MEPDQITDPFCTDEPGAGFQHFIEKDPSVLYQVQMEAMQFLEEGGAYSEDALDKLIRMDADYIKRGISRVGVPIYLPPHCFLRCCAIKFQTRTGQS